MAPRYRSEHRGRTGFFNYYVRLADALGVEPEDFVRAEAEEWARSHAT